MDLAPLVRRLGRGDFLERATQVHRRRAEALGRRPGHRSVEGPVELERRRRRSGTARARWRYRAGSRSPASRATWRGPRSSMTIRAAASSSRRSTGASTCTSPPSERKWATRASANRCEPPRATGQPTACPATESMMPKAAVPQASSARKECAALPAKSACAASPRSPRATLAAGRTAWRPNRAMRTGCRGSRSGGREHVAGELGPGRDERRVQPPPVRPAVAQPCRRGLDRSLEHGRGSVVERMRERRRWLNPLEPVRAQRQAAEERRGDGERVDGGADVVREAGQRELRGPKAAAQRRRRPHAARVLIPAWASTIAAASPLGPDPTTTASGGMRKHNPSGRVGARRQEVRSG